MRGGPPGRPGVRSLLGGGRWTSQGKQVTYLLATRGEAGIDSMPPHEAGPRREAEERAGAAEVGVEIVEFLGLTDGVVEAGLPLRREIARAIRRHKPEIVVSVNFRVSFGGRSFNMADHRVVGEADAGRMSATPGNRWIFPELVDDGFDPWPGVRLVAFSGSPEPTHGVDVTGFVEQGIASLRAHEAYLSNLGGEAFDPADVPGRAGRRLLGLGWAWPRPPCSRCSSCKGRSGAAVLRRRSRRWRRRTAGACGRR